MKNNNDNNNQFQNQQGGTHVQSELEQQTSNKPHVINEGTIGVINVSNPDANKSLDELINSNEIYEIVAVSMDGSEISLFKLNNGVTITKSDAVRLCEAGKLPQCDVGHSKYGEEYLRSRNDGDPSNNLQELPKF